MSQKKARAARQSRASGMPAASTRGRSPVIVGVVAVTVVALVGIGLLAARGTGPAAAVNVSSGKEISLSGTDPVTGEQVSLVDYAGKPVVLNVWGSWCEGCRAEAVDLREFVKKHPEAQTIGIDLQDSKGGAKAFYEQWDWTHPSMFDPDGEISFSLGLQGTPSTFFLDREHRIVTRIVGATDLAGFEQALEQALST